MTRDEAIERAAQKDRPYKPDIDCMAQGELLVNQLVALGMLKLDEPKSGGHAWNFLIYRLGPAAAKAWMEDLDCAGLKITEK